MNNGDKAVRGARVLGWAGIGLGAMKVFAPDAFGKWIGARGRSNVIRAMGVREIAAGLLIVAMPDPALGISARVGGDVLDLTLLTRGLFAAGSEKQRLGTATAMAAGIGAADVVCATCLAHSG